MSEKAINKGQGIYEVKAAISGKEWKDAQDKALKKLVKNVQIKGFRKGQAPLEMAKQHINPSELMDEAINTALPEMFESALKENSLRPFTSPSVNVTKLSDTELEVVFTITVVPEVKLGQYKDIHLKLEASKVTEEEIKASLDKLLEDNSELVLSEEPAKLGDTVIFDFKGYIDGKEFDGGSADNYSLVLGSNSFVPGFEDQLVGVTPETKKDVAIKFPEQYVKDLAGKDAKFVCMVHEVKTKKVPELNDEFAASLEIKDVATVADLKKHQEEVLLGNKAKDAKTHYLQEVINEICKNSEVVIADAVLENEAHASIERTKQQIEQNGLTYQQYLEILGLTEEKLHETAKENAKHELTSMVVLDKIAEVENLLISKKELDEFYENTAKMYGQKVEDVKKMYQPHEREIVSNLLNQKIVNFLEANNAPAVEGAAKEEVKEEKPAKKVAAKKATTAKKPAAKKATKKEEKAE